MKTSYSKEGIIRFEPESTLDSYKVGLLVGHWKKVVKMDDSGIAFGFSSDSGHPKAKLDFVEFPFNRLLDYIFRDVLGK